MANTLDATSMGASINIQPVTAGAASLDIQSTTIEAKQAPPAISNVTAPGVPQKNRPITMPESHTLNVQNSNYNPTNAKGVSEHRPEIISIFDFEPAYVSNTNELSPAGEMLEIQINASKIKSENILDLINTLKSNDATKNFILDLEEKYKNELNLTNADIQFDRAVTRTMAELKKAFNIKQNDYAIKGEVAKNYNNSIDSTKGPKEIMVESLGFQSGLYDNYLNTKILSQLISDLAIICKEYSPLMFAPADRSFELDPFTLNELKDVAGGKFLLTTSDLAQGNWNYDDIKKYNNEITNKLPSDPKNRMMLLTMILSKEFSVSAGLSTTAVISTLKDKFGNPNINNGIFNIILGGVGKSILDPVFGDGSLASMMRTEDGSDIILPFENKFINSVNNKNFIPGSQYYVDSILKGPNKLDVRALTNYTTKFDDIINSVKTVIRNTLLIETSATDNLDANKFEGNENTSTNLKPEKVFNSLLNSILAIFNTDTSQDGGTFDADPNWNTTVIALALIKEAQHDKNIKYCLLYALFYVGYTKNFPNTPLPEPANNFFSTLQQEGFGRLFHNLGLDTITYSQASQIEIVTAAIGNIYGYNLDIKYGEPTDKNTVQYFLNPFLASDMLRNVIKNIFNQIVNFLDQLDNSAKDIISINNSLNNTITTYFNGGGKTKFNGISGFYMVGMAFDLFSSALNELFSFNIVKRSVPGDSVEIKFDLDKIKTTIKNLQFILNPITTEASPTLGNGEIGMQEISSKLRAETSLIKNIVGLFIGINKQIKDSTNNLLDVLSITGPNQRQLEEIFNAPDGKERLASLSPIQTTLAEVIYEEFSSARNSTTSPFMDDSVLTNEQKNILFNMLKEPKYREEEGFNLKLLSIGIPSGFLDSLNARLETFKQGVFVTAFNNETLKETDVIKINVYMQDLQFDDIVFKPQTYIFELSRFISKSNINGIDEINFQNNLQKIKTNNVTINDGGFKRETLADIATKDIYSFLSDKQKKELIENHIQSYIIRLYIKLLTGVNLSENEFILNNIVAGTIFDEENKKIFQDVLSAHISNIAGQKITLNDLRLNNKNIDNILKSIDSGALTSGIVSDIDVRLNNLSKDSNLIITEDVKSFIRTFSPRSIMFGANTFRKKITSPKTFERIFNIAIDPDSFIIDEEATLKTTSGNLMWNQNFFKIKLSIEYPNAGGRGGGSNIQTVNDKPIYRLARKRKKENSSEFLRFFVTIEQLPESVPGAEIVITKVEPASQVVPPPAAATSTNAEKAISSGAQTMGPSRRSGKIVT